MHTIPLLRRGLSLLALLAPVSALAFSDVPSAHVHADAVAYMQSEGIVQGYADGTFRPDAPITRAELVKILLETKKENKGEKQCFPDVGDEWFAPYVCAGKRLGVIAGYADGTFRPGTVVTFAEASKIIVNALTDDAAPTDGPWYEAFVASLESSNAIPLDITRLTQPLTRGQMAEIVFRLRTQPRKPTQTYAMLSGSVETSSSKNSATARSSSSSSSSSAQVSLPLSLAISADWKNLWNVRSIQGSLESYGNVEVMTEEGNQSFFRILFPKNSGTRSLWLDYDKPLGGVVTWVNPGFTPQPDLYLRYRFRLPTDFSFHKGGVLPGLLTGMQTGRTQESAASVLLGWTAEGKLEVSGNFSDTTLVARNYISTTSSLATDGKWHTLDLHVKLNTAPGKSNGLLQVWLDGEAAVNAKTVNYPNRTQDLWDGLLLVSNVGSNDIFSVAPKDMHLDLADFQFSTTPFPVPSQP